MIAVRLSADAKVKLRKMIDRKVADVAAKAATVAYNTAISYKEPYWSGQFAASWQVSHGAPASLYLPATGRDSSGAGAAMHYPRHTQVSVLPDYASPYQKIYVSNTAPHAMMIEYEGSPNHAGAWKIAFSSKQSAMKSIGGLF